MKAFRKITAFCATIFISVFASAEIVTSDIFGYSLDVPEGFEILDMTENQDSVQFQQKYFPATIILCVYKSSEQKDAQTALSFALSRLGAKEKTSSLTWHRLPCAVSEFVIENQTEAFGNEKQRGYAASIPLPAKESILVALSFLPESVWSEGDCVPFSAIDSIVVDAGSSRECGILTSFFFPQKKKMPLNLEIAGEKIQTELFEEDSKANQAVIDREFKLFLIYAQNALPEAIASWQRFYRMIMRDSLGRTKRVAFDIVASLQSKTLEMDEKNPHAALAALILEWTQNLKYARNLEAADKADFSNIVCVLTDNGSDCDSRSLLAAVLLKHSGIQSCFFVSVAYSHAILGVSLDGKMGQAFDVDGVTYLVGDTTAKGTTLGMIARDQADKSRWIPVEFPF